ncbi:Hint domain-containing protein [Falsiruegeria mediterranea]|uniref:Hedgehog/Intein (Hint) domain-containing protein n=1 Tax=Falsiruegeria mediterranea M17 TaxID=1200281 RepID=A0A2R8CAQ2_9RHOB|nr:Hint domain-containing protein [Falsiruegeria mediterranea]SPJ29517.1 hypothetical protein TRM7615_03037 [Falsiruegeria mediterranea M17]
MAVEVLTISLTEDQEKVKGDDYITGDRDDNQIVTVLDGGDLDDDDPYVFEFWGKDTPTEPGAGPGGDDQFSFDLSGFDDDFDIEIKSFDEGDCFIFTNFDSYSVVGNVWTFDYTGSDGQPHTVSIDAESTNGTGVACIVVCFAKGTKIRVPAGQMAIEDLQVGDMVHCGDGMQRPIRWIGSRAIDQQTLDLHPELRPVQIKTGALEPGYPARDLYLSPQHRVLLRDWRAELLFGEDEVLATASSLINDSTIRPDMECTQVEYFHLLLDGHQTVFANGIECETLMPAEMAQNALPAEARTEICAIFPELATDLGSFGPLYRMALKPTEIRAMMAL